MNQSVRQRLFRRNAQSLIGVSLRTVWLFLGMGICSQLIPLPCLADESVQPTIVQPQDLKNQDLKNQTKVLQEDKPQKLAPELFNQKRLGLAFILLVICGSIMGCLFAARSGRKFYVRPIPALTAVTEAVGRATEMGRSCLFVTGLEELTNIQTVAGLTVLGHVAKQVAEYGATLEVPTSRSLVMTAARETVQAAYFAAGRPEAYRPDNVNYLSDEQFAFVAGVTGKMLRDPPAACFYFGAFYAESLFLAETGNSIGAIQIAGTAEPSQLPFFVAACDYALIGEEFFAASAYLSGEPEQVGTLRGQDFGKLLGVVLIVGGCSLATLTAFFPNCGMAVEFLKKQVLGG